MPATHLAAGEVLVPRPDPTQLTTEAVEKARVEIEKLFDAKLDTIHTLMDEKFKGVSNEFYQRDLAVQAAFKASQESVLQQNHSNNTAAEKLAISFTKQIDALDEKIDEVKERINDLKDRISSNTGHITGVKDMGGWIFGLVMFIVAAATLVVTIVRPHL